MSRGNELGTSIREVTEGQKPKREGGREGERDLAWFLFYSPQMLIAYSYCNGERSLPSNKYIVGDRMVLSATEMQSISFNLERRISKERVKSRSLHMIADDRTQPLRKPAA